MHTDEQMDARTLDLETLRRANAARAKQWDPGNTIPLMFAMMELAGEAGEACNAAKKLARHELGLAGGNTDIDALAQELADVVICCDLAAMKAGINLAEAVVAKFNATSDKHGFTVKLALQALRAGGKE